MLVIGGFGRVGWRLGRVVSNEVFWGRLIGLGDYCRIDGAGGWERVRVEVG